MKLSVNAAAILVVLLLFAVQAKAEGQANANLNNAGFTGSVIINFGIVFFGLAGIIFGICAIKTAKQSIDVASIKA